METTINETTAERSDGKITTIAFRANVVDGGVDENKNYDLCPGKYPSINFWL